jgi:hypothetical protein
MKSWPPPFLGQRFNIRGISDRPDYNTIAQDPLTDQQTG